MVRRLWQVIAVSLIFLCLVGCNAPQHKKAEKRNVPVELLHDGDIAFRRGMGVMSQIVLMANRNGSFSHVGIVTMVDGVWCVIHEVPYEGESEEDDRVYCEEIGEFFNTIKASSGAIYRLDGLDSLQREAICNYAQYHLSQKTPFDHDYDLDDDSKQYCSELVWRSYLEVGVDITKGNRTVMNTLYFNGEYIVPSDIEMNRDIVPIYRF